jgi:hypothetical protein
MTFLSLITILTGTIAVCSKVTQNENDWAPPSCTSATLALHVVWGKLFKII